MIPATPHTPFIFSFAVSLASAKSMSPSFTLLSRILEKLEPNEYLRLLQNQRPKERSSFRAGEALHRMVFRAKRDPESSPAIGGIQAILDSRFRGNDGTGNSCKRLTYL